MKPRVPDPFPATVELRRGRRRTIEVALENGRFVARVPQRAEGPELEAAISRLRASLWERLQRDSVYDDATLGERAARVRARWFAGQTLPPFRVRFSRRQNKRWGSCTFDGRSGRIRISAHLMGHPRWVIDAVLHHEIAHLLVADHGPDFQALVRANPDHDRAQGYLEALETVDRLGLVAPVRLAQSAGDTDAAGQPTLFEGDQSSF